MNWRLRSRAAAWLLSAAMVMGLFPATAWAANPPEDAPPDAPYEETATVDVEYGDVDRTTATITYHKEGIPAEPVNLIFMVDVSVTGRESHGAFESMMLDNGLSYIYDYGVNSSTRLITYQNTVADSEWADTQKDLMEAINAHTNPGEGVANEPAALKKAIEAVQDTPVEDAPTVVFWVLGDHFGWGDEAEIEKQVAALKEALGEDDALITWQLADQPNEMLTRYATQHGEAHSDATITAAHAEDDAVVFQNELRADLEQIVRDHYHDIDFTLKLADSQTLVSRILSGHYESASAYVDMAATPTADGKGIDVHLEHVCRQSDIDFVLEVELNQDVYERQTVIPAGSITAPEDHTNGGLHTGIFDEGTAYGLTLHMPAVELDRTRSTMTFRNDDGGMVSAIQELVGTTVTIPDGGSLSNPGSSFGGWNVVSGTNQGAHYSAGEIIAMPAGDMVLEPAWGHVEVELEVGGVQEGEAPGNQLADDVAGKWSDEDRRLFLNDVTADSGLVIDNDDIISLSVIDQMVTYDKIVDDNDPHRVKLTNIPNAVYARHVGQTEDDKVVLYLVPHQTEAGKYDAYIAGAGGVKAPESIASFIPYTGIETADLRALDTSGVKRMDDLFNAMGALRTIDIRGWDTSQVTSMPYMFSTGVGGGPFYSALEEIIGIEDLDVSSVVDMSSMFDGAGYTYNTGTPTLTLKSLDLSKWDTSSVEDMSQMFAHIGLKDGSLDLSSFDTSSVTDMSYMFYNPYPHNLTTLTFGDDFDTSRVTDMRDMFYGCYGLTSLDLSSFDTSNVTNMSYMFVDCSGLETLILGENFDTSSVTDMSFMFSGCSSLETLTLPDAFNTSSVTHMGNMFSSCSGLTELDLSAWDTSSVTSMRSMFSGCSGLTELDLSDWDTSSVTYMGNMFFRCSGLTSLDVSGWDTSNVTNMGGMFSSCSKLTELDVSGFDTSKVTDMSNMFNVCSDLESLDLGSFDTSSVTDMGSMFSSCTGLVTLDLGDQFDISNAAKINQMFYNCSALESVSGKIKLGTENACTNISNMFSGCIALKTVDFFEAPVSGASFPGLSGISMMFSSCEMLESVDLSGWILPNLTDLRSVFYGCYELETVNLSWSGMRAKADDLSLTSTFYGVPEASTLEIGSDTSENTKAVMEAIAQEFLRVDGRSVTSDGSPWTSANGINELPLPDEPAETPEPTPAPEPEEPPIVDEPAEEQPSERPVEEEPAETPDVEQSPDEPGSNNVDTPDVPSDPSEEAQPPKETNPSEDTTSPEEPVTPDNDTDTPETTETPEATEDHMNGATSAAMSILSAVRNLGASVFSLPANEDGVSIQAGEGSTIRVHPTATEAGSVVQYRIRVKYVGDMGAQSGQIQLNFPIPDDVHVLTADEITSELTEQYGVTEETIITVSDRQYSDGDASGYLGGRVVEEPKIVEEGGKQYLRGTFEGLFTGNEYEIAIWCVLESTSNQDTNGYSIWDGTAYAQDKAASAVSNVYRLWWKDSGSEPVDPPEPTEHTVTYQFRGDVPADAVLPLGGVYDKGKTVTVASEPTTTYSYYKFGDWTSEDVNISGNSFEMPDHDVTITGTWSIDEANAPKVTVSYQYANYGESGHEHVPDGAPTLPGTEAEDPAGGHPIYSTEYRVGVNPAIVNIQTDADHHVFMGWVPTLTIGGNKVALTDDDGTYTGTYNDVTYTIPTTGLLQTEQFRAAAGASDVTVAYTGQWRPYTADIIFDGNGGETTDGDTSYWQANVTWDTQAALTGNRFVHSRNYDFVGWSLTPSGAVAKADGASASGLITEDGTDVTLYAQWKRDTYGVGYNLTHVISSSNVSSVNRGDTYTTTLTPENGYQMDSVVVSMGGVTVPGAYNPTDGSVTVRNANGTIIITATAVPVSTPPAKQHTITISVTGGTASPSGTVRVNNGDSQTITFTPNSGYELKSVTVDGSSASLTGNSYTFTNVTSNHTIAVVYEKDSGGGSGGGGGSTTDRYIIDAEAGHGGSISPDGRVRVERNDDQTFRITADEGYEIADVLVDGKSVGVVSSYIFENVRANHTIHVSFAASEEIPIADPDDTGVSDWLNTDDHMAYLNGYPDNTFRPGDNMTRAEAAQMFYNLLLDKDVAVTASFKDVPANAWYSEAVNTLATLGMINGVGENRFEPDRSITRAEFTAIAMRFANLPEDGENIFSDVTTSDWFYDVVVGSIQYGWINGYSDGTFRPNNTITRVEVTTIVNHMLGRVPDETFINSHADGIHHFIDVYDTYWAYYNIVEATNSHGYNLSNGTEAWTELS